MKIAADIAESPHELFELAETLKSLDFSGNRLSCLPCDAHRFKKLWILFLSDNNFNCFPAVLAQCPVLSMVTFKVNRIGGARGCIADEVSLCS